MAKRTIIVWDSNEDLSYVKCDNTELASQLLYEKQEKIELLHLYGKTNDKSIKLLVNGKPAIGRDWATQTDAEEWISFVQSQAAKANLTIFQTHILDSVS